MKGSNLFDLSGQFALITGAAGLLGMKHAEAILHAGGTPILTDFNLETLTSTATTLSEKFGCAVPFYKLDVTDEKNIVEVANEIHRKNQQVDVLINNAARNPVVGETLGVAGSSRLEFLNLDSFQKDLNVTVTGATLCSKIFGSVMAQRGHGVIINVASDLAVIAPDQRLYSSSGDYEDNQDVKPVSYSVAKHALIGLTKYIATYWAHKGVRCNALSPGGVYNKQHEGFVERIEKLIPLRRMAKVDEYMGAIIFLSSDASAYMNGTNLIIDGGRSIW